MYKGYNKETKANSRDAVLVSLLLTFNMRIGCWHFCRNTRNTRKTDVESVQSK